ncbi:MAG TPA: ABC transporter substrate-binding protein [Bacillota bacterium]|nr:ABC transporter substrate-binding protein [Bacillota bacterium]HOH09406.1 ABC transporter substrate-binding protein [Bacillota bacterium]HOS49897.1 ABC transporter substrate-binding protein [Bacillota bacterium]HOY89319.1 ABC transporter substrate-binding protein [Bacillota bacterium]HPI01013.1 ABC transporter substrate-binding protein [Bacillota bacterium]
MKRIVLIVMLIALMLPTFAAVTLSAPAAITVYSSVDEENAKKILDAFTKSTGIPYKMVFLSSGPAIARIEAEKDNPQADIWMGAPSENHVTVKDRGLTQPYVSPNAAILKKQFKDSAGYWTCFYMNPMGVGVRTDFLSRVKADLPKTWQDLLKPEFKGQIQYPSPQTSGTGYNMVIGFVKMWGEDAAFAYLKKLHANVQLYTQSGTAPSQNLAIGQTAVGIQFTPAILKAMDDGYPVALVFPSEGVTYEAPAVSILKGAKNLDGAKALVDWLISLEGQNVIASSKTYFYPIHPNAKLAAGMPAFNDINTVEVDTVWAAGEKTRIVNKWIAEVLQSK